MNLKSTINIFGRAVPVSTLAFLALAGLGSAALLAYYGQITGTVIVTQAVVLAGTETYNYPSAVAGSTVIETGHSLTNEAGVPATVKFQTTYSPDGIGITTTYRGILNLTTKNVVFGTSPWTENSNKKATIWYTITGDAFDWGYVSSTGFNENNYALIYYKDNYPNRFDSPALASDIAGNLPYVGDANMDNYDYCASGTEHENYNQCHGAKLWLVPITDIDPSTKALTWADASNFLFETDLIQYNQAGQIILYPGSVVGFDVANEFAVGLQGGTYTITTSVVPV